MKKFLPLLIALIGAPLLCLMISNTAVTFGDKAFLADKLQEGKNWYVLAKIINPFNQQIPNRLLAITVNLDERLHASEETTPLRQLATTTKPTQVLGVSSCIPVLMYHYIRVNPWPTDTVGFGLSTPPYAFAEQLDYFKSKGYTTVTLTDLKNHLAYGKALDAKKKNPYIYLPNPPKPLPAKPLIITLDDGYADAYSQGFPLLKERDMKAVEFVITGFVGLPNYLTWQEVEALDASGVVDIESHTVHHYALGGSYWSLETIQKELTQSKKELEDHLKKIVEWLAYPYGSVDNRVSQEAAKVYYAAFGTNFGSYQSTEEEMTLNRIRVGGGDNGASIDARIHTAQQDAKCIQ